MDTLKIIFLIIFFFLTFNQITAQISIDGTVTDAELNPISNAFIEIFDESDTAKTYSSNTNDQGYFNISVITDLSNDKNTIPKNHIVLSNYPNPFNPSTLIYYELPKDENIEITIYDILGREVRTLYNEFHKAGTYTLNWDGRNNWNSPVAAGIYLSRLKTKDQFKVHKMVLLDGGSGFTSTNMAKIENTTQQSISKINTNFNFIVKVSGENILETEFKDFSCVSDTTLNLLVPRILQSAIIGLEGGKIEIDGFSLTIPDGAFSENATLKLALNPNLHESFLNTITKVYRIDSFPNQYLKPLKIKLKYIDESEDSVFFGLGYKSIDPTTGNDGLSFNFFEAEDSSGYLIATLPSSNNSDSQSLLKSADFLPLKGKLFMGLAGYGVGEDSEHFSFFSSKLKYISLSYPIVESAEKAFNDFCDILKLDKIEFWNKYKQHSISNEIEIYTYNSLKANSVRPHRYCIYHLPYIEGKNTKYSKLEFDLKIDDSKANQSELDYLLRDLYHYIYFLFPVNQYTDNYELTNQFWFHHAIAAWSEELYSSDNFKSPIDFNLHYKAPFGGIQRFLETSPNSLEAHGIGMSALIKHLTNVNGNSIVGKFFNGLKSNPNALEVILDTLNYSYSSSESTWWPNFFKEFLQGNIYNLPGEEFLTSVSETIELNDGDTLKYVEETYNDLSAKLFRIKINSEEIKTKTLNFKIDSNGINIDYVKALVFGLSNNNLIYLSDGTDFNISNFQAYDALLACVVNSGNEPPYTGTSKINLDIKVTNDLAFRHCDINFAVIEMHDTLEGVWSPGWYTDGVFKENVFTGTINKERQGGNAIGSIRVEVDDNHNITYLDVMAYHSDQFGSSQWGFTASNIPPTENEPYLLVYSYSGYNVCNYVNSIYAKYTYANGDETEIRNFKCDDESVIHVKFHNWD